MGIKLDAAMLDLIDRRRKPELGARFRIEADPKLQRLKLDTDKLDLIDRCRKRELGARFRIEADQKLQRLPRISI